MKTRARPRLFAAIAVHLWAAGGCATPAPLRDRIPVALALGMANPHTLQAALD